MNYQGILFSNEQITLLFTTLIVALIIFLFGVVITRWWAIKEGWNESYNSSISLNSFWLIINLSISIILMSVPYGIFIATICEFIINLFIGALITSKIYKKNYKKSFIFIFFLLIALLIFYFIVYLIVIIILAIILLGIKIN